MRLTLAFCLATSLVFAADSDLDRDGLGDQFEQQILERFVPAFQISTSDCAGTPSAFQAGSAYPQPVARNTAGATIYAQATPSLHHPGQIELHYYHLWANDCGTPPHPLDAEHVSALVRTDSPSADPQRYTAAYWFAAAHQDTVCDASQGARAAHLNATTSGPRVWISSGKHASFLSLESCAAGCGADRCPLMHALDVNAIVNLGEPGHPLNGTVWAKSQAWPLAAKMTTDFAGAIIPLLDAAPAGTIVSLSRSPTGLRTIIMTSHRVASGLLTGPRASGNALNATGGATGTGISETGSALDRSFSETAGATSTGMTHTGTGMTHTRDAVAVSFAETGNALGQAAAAAGLSLQQTGASLKRAKDAVLGWFGN